MCRRFWEPRNSEVGHRPRVSVVANMFCTSWRWSSSHRTDRPRSPWFCTSETHRRSGSLWHSSADNKADYASCIRNFMLMSGSTKFIGVHIQRLIKNFSEKLFSITCLTNVGKYRFVYSWPKRLLFLDCFIIGQKLTSGCARISVLSNSALISSGVGRCPVISLFLPFQVSFLNLRSTDLFYFSPTSTIEDVWTHFDGFARTSDCVHICECGLLQFRCATSFTASTNEYFLTKWTAFTILIIFQLLNELDFDCKCSSSEL